MEKTAAPPKVEKEKLEDFAPLYNVVLLNDDLHSYEYVIEMLQKLFLHSATDAFQHAYEVDSAGRTVVITCGLLEAQFGRDQIHAYGPDPRIPACEGSMRSIIEMASGQPDVA